jgi:hypothetical protein
LAWILSCIRLDLQHQRFGHYQIHVRVDLVKFAKVVDERVGRVEHYVQVEVFASIRVEFLMVQVVNHGKQRIAKLVGTSVQIGLLEH